MALCIVHAADLHLDTPFSGLGRVAPDVAAALQDASLKAWDNLVRLTLDERADVLLLAGDIYDGPERGLRAQLRVLEGLRRLSGVGVRTFIVHGDQDPLDGNWSAVRRWPDGVHFFGTERVERIPLGEVAGVSGISCARRDEPRDLAALFGREVAGGLEIGLLHCSLGADPAHAPCAPTTAEELADAGLDYWALGHVHTRREVHAGHPWIEYPGNLQGLSPAPGELGPKGALVVRADPERGQVDPPRLVPLDSVRFLDLSLDVSEAPDVPAALGLVGEALDATREAHAGRGLILRLTLGGRGAAGGDLRARGASEILRQLREEALGQEPLVWWQGVTLDFPRGWRREDLLGRGDFVAELLTQVDKLAEDPLPFVREAGRISATLAGRARAAGLDERTAAALLAAAEDRCLDLLLPGGGDGA